MNRGISKSEYKIIVLVAIITIVFIVLVHTEIVLSYLDKHSAGITAISALIAVISGSVWFDTSKRKMKGNLDYDIARKYLRAVLRLRDTIRIMRHPMVPIEEMQNSLKQFGYDETDHENREKTNRAVYSIRWNKVQEAWTNLEEILSEAEISWGSEAIDIQKGLDGLVRELRGVFWLFLNFKDDVKINDGNFKIIYSSLDKNDKFSLRIDDEVDRIKKFLEKYL